MKPQKKFRFVKAVLLVFLFTLILLITFPFFVNLTVEKHQNNSLPPNTSVTQFPVTVDPQRKIIVENPEVDKYLEGSSSPLTASVTQSSSGSEFWNMVNVIAIKIVQLPLYENVASAVGIQSKLVTITPGLRKEEVAALFAKSLSWNKQQTQDFLAPAPASNVVFSEGTFLPGTYSVKKTMTPQAVRALITTRFQQDIVSHYGTSTAKLIPLSQALTIASIIQRETIRNNDVRLISGIIWNRLFDNMNLQIDSTLQYAVANQASTNIWWPPVLPAHKYVKSPYNTYMNTGLPPAPIANPSIGAIIAALNPIKTPCFYYFNDSTGKFHCSETYKEHVDLLKKYYGQGK